MSNIAVIPKIDLPPALMAQFQGLVGTDDLNSGISAGFPTMSIRGSKWRIVQNGEETPVYLPGTRDLAPFVKVVIAKANPAVSKTYYPGDFVEGSDTPPDCSSNDGIAPLPDSPHPQSASCASCPHNVWGSKISKTSGAKVKACADVRRVAILPAEDLSYSPILLRVPGASLSDLAGYGRALKQRNIPYSMVVTKLSFDPDAAYPKISFSFDRVLTADEANLVLERVQEPVIEDILGGGRHDAAPSLPNTHGIPDNVELPPAAAQIEQAEETKKPTVRTRKAEPAPEPEPEPTQPDAANMLDDIDNVIAGLKL